MAHNKKPKQTQDVLEQGDIRDDKTAKICMITDVGAILYVTKQRHRSNCCVWFVLCCVLCCLWLYVCVPVKTKYTMSMRSMMFATAGNANLHMYNVTECKTNTNKWRERNQTDMQQTSTTKLTQVTTTTQTSSNYGHKQTRNKTKHTSAFWACH